MLDETSTDGSVGRKRTDGMDSRRVSRRGFIVGGAAGTTALTGLAGCSGVLGGGGSEPITMLLTPDTPSDVRPQYAPVHDMLEGEIDGLDLEMEVPQDYSAVRTALESEQAEIGMDDVTLISKPDMMDLFGTAVTGGTAFYFSMMLTKPDSDIDERTDIEGKNMAFADRLSTSGSIFAVYALKEAGLDVGDAPDGDPVDFEGTWSNHGDAVQRVLNDEADACTTWSGNGMAYLAEDQELPDRVAEEDSFIGNRGQEGTALRPFWWSFPIPKQPIYARQSWDSPMKAKIREQLIASDESLIQEYLPEDYNENDLPFTTLEETTMDNYEPVIKRLNDLGIDLG
ncbi:phosphonate transport system substrate-binding protein [Halomicrobium zhouii]|uniref:Phosphonate transport system substrate-binding protein n=1 Tax=Halomicrobium zhouii TaxID=767519 RepID=A0A1I6KI04_9EURY|nr:PhnD/SsuA/transferrin family substrate-binding protein [Halomicrobium zhouii]SFR90826.1 phosphonate transport system substrate-binding protein [Halomicrobium zhouii]